MAEGQNVLEINQRTASSFVEPKDKPNEGGVASNQQLLLLMAQNLGLALPAMQEALHDKDLDKATDTKDSTPVQPSPKPFMPISESANLQLEKEEISEEVNALFSQLQDAFFASINDAQSNPEVSANPHIAAKVHQVKTAAERLALLTNPPAASKGAAANSGDMPEATAEQIKEAALALGAVICEMLILLINDAEEHGKISTQDGEALLLKIQGDLSDLINQINEQKEAQDKADTWGLIGKIFSAIFAAIMTIVAVVTLQPELIAVAVIAITFMAVALANKSITQPIVDALKSAGLPDSVANIMAAIIVIVAVTIITMGTGSAGITAETAGETAVDLG